MSPATQAFLSGGLTFGAVLLIALNELRNLRRNGGDGDGPNQPPQPPPPLPLPVGSRPLPACLVPNEHWRAPSRPRLPELV